MSPSEPRTRLEEFGDLLTAAEVAEFLRVHVDCVYAAIRRGDIPATRVGRHIRVAKSRLAAHLDGQQRAT